MSKFKEMSDLELMREISRYESRALEELYDRYSPLLFTLIKKIAPNQTIAEDILADVFVIIWRKISKFDFNTGNVYTWLVTLARNKAIDFVRRERMAGQTVQLYDDEYEDYFIIPTFDKSIDSLDFKTATALKPNIERALSKLTDTQKYVLHLAYYEGYTIDEIADKLNVPIETVRLKVMNALHSLRDYLVKG
ncbi:RNA polymerase sigma factor [Stygiobacter electus]|uniref:Sigma-70 family RNA polymerase sigma factor n=1 Tax=Stygiobacter electus TaxID=3032292 RepID=A0AAE3P0M3_9BACT|nr:sigma-70 family RNA polymerase sigma factor [Stygiobacter electus]MDF1612080.1 sigma-70 family RNA polymerase sigma factor [Stygiobacter electus]